MYSPRLLDHFEHPCNSGIVPDANATVQLENPVCGDVLKLTAKIADGRVSEIRFQAKGCVPAMACGSALTRLVSGKTILSAAGLSPDDLIRELDGIPQASSHAAQLAIDALRALLANHSV